MAGSFDDCQRLAKQALVDPILTQKLTITSANSINIARLIPQMFYYFAAFSQLRDPAIPLVFSVPSGNFGNLTGGLAGQADRAPGRAIHRGHQYKRRRPRISAERQLIPRASRHTLSNAMDVGNPSNFARLVDLYDNDLHAIRQDIWGCSFSDEETLRAMHDVDQRYNYIARSAHSRRRARLGKLCKAESGDRAGDRPGHRASREVRGDCRPRHRHPARNAGAARRLAEAAEAIDPISQPLFRSPGISSILKHLILVV